MDDASAQLSEIAQQLAALAAAAKQLSEQPLFEPDLPANENQPDRQAEVSIGATPPSSTAQPSH